MAKRKSSDGNDGDDDAQRKAPRYDSQSGPSPKSLSSMDHDQNDKISLSIHVSDSYKQASKQLQVIEKIGDIWEAPANTVLIHACNSEGHWGKGIAAAFKQRYPEAFKVYAHHCRASKQIDLPSTALLIHPQIQSKNKIEASARHFVGCLFTSRSKGRSKDPPKKILENTAPAMRHLLAQINQFNSDCGDGREEGQTRAEQLWMCRINSGLFKVPWESTKAVLEEIEVREDTLLTVVEKG